MHTELRAWISDPVWRAAIVLVVTVVVAFVVRWMIHAVIGSLVRRTASNLDDEIFAATRRPLLVTLIMVGLYWVALDSLEPRVAHLTRNVLSTVAVVLWLVAALQVSSLTFKALGHRSAAKGLLQARTVPAYDMLVKVTLLALSIYVVFLVWDIDLTAWLASAGIAGIAVGFAAKDTLANLFAGLFIMADAPYKVGDYIVIEGGLRGKVTHIGMRSTRILTRDDVEITVPNSVIGNSQIINEDGGPFVHQRVRVPVSVAYGSDIDRVREVLLACPRGMELVRAAPEPRVRFREFGESGLAFELLVWIDNAEMRGALLDELNSAVYKAFAGAGIEIPYNKLDVYVKQLPR